MRESLWEKGESANKTEAQGKGLRLWLGTFVLLRALPAVRGLASLLPFSARCRGTEGGMAASFADDRGKSPAIVGIPQNTA